MSGTKDRGLGGFELGDRRRERSAAAQRSATAGARAMDPDEQGDQLAAVDASSSDARAPMPPPRRRRQVRVQLNTRIVGELHERLQRFVVDHDAAVQDVVETALTEYLDRRS